MQPSTRNPEKYLQRLDWSVVRRLDGALQGDYRTLFQGFGLELSDLREYQATDDVRHIDWNVTARMDTPYVRQYIEEREVTAWFLLDLSPSVDFGTVQTLKRNLLIDFVSVLARLLARHGNRVGAILYSGKVDKVIPAGGGKPQVLHLIDSIMRQPQQVHTPPTDLSALLETAYRVIRRKSLIFIVSDFISAPGWDRPLTLLTQKHEVLAVRLYDPREMELPDIGTVTMEDAETGEQLFLDTHDRKFRERFREAALRRDYEREVTFRRTGVDKMELSTEGDLVKEVLRFATLRKQQKKAPASFNRKSVPALPQRR
ncbi:MAG: DUF58 domain-containing protein [Chloroflexota bacterium]